MKYVFSALLFLLFFASTAHSQDLTVTGTVVDSAKGAVLRNANVMLIHLPDSTRSGAVTGADGKFAVKDLVRGRYLLRITYIGYKTHTRQIQLSDKTLALGKITLAEDQVRMGAVDIEGKLPVAVVKDDTTEISASAFKVNPDASAEDLVTKMPGVVKQGGQVQAQGETVKEVQVDGRRFMGSDPTAALRNIPAEIIDRIQIFDQQSEQSRFTGFDDGNTSKTINIVTRGGVRHGQFGKFSAGYGADDEYDPGQYNVGGSLNLFDGDRRLTLLAMSNNVNEQNFAIEDIVGSMGGGGGPGGGTAFRAISSAVGGSGGASRIISMVGGRGGGRGGFGGGISDFLVNPSGGLSTTHAFGLNYTDKWTQKLDVQGSYFFNFNDNSSENDIFRQYVLSSSASQTYEQSERAASENMNHRFNLRMEWEIDTMNSILFRPRFSAQQNEGRSDLWGRNMDAASPLNLTNTLRNTELDGINASGELLYRRRFETRGRTFTLRLEPGYNRTNGDAALQSDFRTFGMDSTYELLDQRSDLLRNGWSMGGEASYTEPLFDNLLMQFSYNASKSWDESEKNTFNASVPGLYDLLDTALTNTYENSYLRQSASTDLQYRTEELNASAGVSYQWSTLSGEQLFPYSADISHSFRNVLPNARVRWRLSREQNLMGFYRARTNAPSVTQLQDVVDNSNPLQLSAGNPSLQPDYQHFFMLRYQNADFMRFTYFFAMLNGSYTYNSIQNNVYIAEKDTAIGGIPLLRGAQLTRPENIDGAYSLRGLVTYGMPVSWLMSNVNITAFANLSRTPGTINGVLNESTSPSVGLSLVLASNISPEIDFSVSSLSILTSTRNSLQSALDAEYWSQNTRLRLNWIFWKGFVLSSDLSHQYTSGYAEGYNQNIVLWNVGIAKKFLPKDAAEIRLTLFDVLNQNTNTTRSANELYIEDARSNTLRRYGLLTFSYTLRSFGSGGGFPDRGRGRGDMPPPDRP